MNSIIELQVLNYIIQDKSLDILTKNNISYEQFSDNHKQMAEFIYNHNDKYGAVPDKETMVSNFPEDFTVIEVTESTTYLSSKLRDYLMYYHFGKQFPQVKELFEKGLVSEALSNMMKLSNNIIGTFSATGIGSDIMDALSRYEMFEQRINGEGEKPIPLGLGIDMEDALGGVLRDDVFLLMARTSHGKSFLMTYLAHNLHQQGLRVLYYSGEMEPEQVGYRYDSIHEGFSSKALLFGKGELGRNKSPLDYKKYTQNLSTNDVPFIVVHPRDLGGRFININDINKLVDDHKPDVIFVDQLSLVEDIRSNKNTQERIKYGNIMADLRLISNNERIPIFVAVQANRQGAQKNDDEEFIVPELSHIAESDAVSHHSTRVLSFATNEGKMKIAIRKNRHGILKQLTYLVDFGYGTLTPLVAQPIKTEMPEGMPRVNF